MRKLIPFLLCGALTFSTVSFVGCKGNSNTTEETETTTEETKITTTEESEITTEETETTTTEESETTAEETEATTTAEDTSRELDATDLDVSMEVMEDTVTPTSAEVQITNNSGYTLLYGAYYSINFWNNDEWEELPIDENIAFASVGYENAEQQFTETIKWKSIYGELPAGTYQIVKNFSAEDYNEVNNIEEDYENIKYIGFDLTAEFTIE